MSIIETFYLLFKADTQDLDKKTANVKKTTKDLNDDLKVQKENLSGVGKQFLETARYLGELATAYISVKEVVEGIKDAFDFNTQLDFNSRMLQANAQELAQWGDAIKLAGGTAEEFQASLRSLSQHTGLTPELALQLLPQFADVFKSMNQIQRMRVGEMFGLSDHTVFLLSMGRKELEQILQKQKELAHITEGSLETDRKFNASIIEMQIAFRGLFTILGSMIFPILTKVFDKITEWVSFFTQNADYLKGALIGLTTGITVLAVMAIPALIAGLAALAPVLAPLLLIAGVISSFVYLGMVSVKTGKDFVTLWRNLTELFSNLKKYFNQQYGKAMHDELESLSERWTRFGNLIKSIFDKLKTYILDALKDLSPLARLFDNVVNLFSSKKDSSNQLTNQQLQQGLALGQNAMQFMSNSTIGISPPSSTLFNNKRAFSVNVGDVTIHTNATNSEDISQNLVSHLQDHFSIANSQFDDGIDK